METIEQHAIEDGVPEVDVEDALDEAQEQPASDGVLPLTPKLAGSILASKLKPKISDAQEEQELEPPLPEDIFSLMYLAKPFGWTCLYCLFVFAVQSMVIILIMSDLLDLDSKYNPLQVPPGVAREVTIAQFVSMVLAVSTQTNLLTALSRLAAWPNYDHDYVRSVYPGAASPSAYMITLGLQLFNGIAMLVDNFVLNMQATSVLGLMLNFAALSFISEIQELAFWLGKDGYVSERLRVDSRLVTNFELPRQDRQISSVYIKRILFGLITSVLMLFAGLMVNQQREGRFMCNRLEAQFGDGFRYDLSFYSGLYKQSQNRLIEERAVYEDEKGSGAYFAYCAKEKAWTFSGPINVTETLQFGRYGADVSAQQSGDPCDYYWAKSQMTTTYDITDTFTSPWFVLDYNDNQTIPIDYMRVLCIDCDGARATLDCNGHGTCEDNSCVCDEDRIGINCQYAMPCEQLRLDQRKEPFPYASGGLFIPGTDYELMRNNESQPVLVYNKPVYYSTLGSTSIPLNVIMFTGRRWGLFLNLDFLDASEPERLREGLPSYLPSEFHPWFSKNRIYFYSDPMDLGTPSMGTSPVDLEWYRSRQFWEVGDRAFFRADLNQPTGTVLLCPACQKVQNICLNGGDCLTEDGLDLDEPTIRDVLDMTGTCECQRGFVGHLCEREADCFEQDVTCYNGGKCMASGSCECDPKYSGKLCQFELQAEFLASEFIDTISSGPYSFLSNLTLNGTNILDFVNSTNFTQDSFLPDRR